MTAEIPLTARGNTADQSLESLVRGQGAQNSRSIGLRGQTTGCHWQSNWHASCPHAVAVCDPPTDRTNIESSGACLSLLSLLLDFDKKDRLNAQQAKSSKPPLVGPTCQGSKMLSEKSYRSLKISKPILSSNFITGLRQASPLHEPFLPNRLTKLLSFFYQSELDPPNFHETVAECPFFPWIRLLTKKVWFWCLL